jgi:uncharacterized protein
MPPVSVLIKPASGMCNMHCDYCFYCDETSKREQASYGFMSEETLKNVIRKTLLNADGAASYMFQGGEPTLAGLPFFEKVLEYQRQYNKKGIPIYNAIQTNGLLLDESWCRFLHDHHFLVGLSLDGTEDIYNSLRHLPPAAAREHTSEVEAIGSSKNTAPDHSGCTAPSSASGFARACHAAELMERFQVEFNILTVVTPAIAEQADRVYAFYKEKGWLYQQYIACLDPLGEGHGKTAYALTPEVYGHFLIRMFQLWYADVKKGRAPYNRQFDNYVSIAAGYLPASCDQCGVCSVQHVVEANGNVYPCDFYMLDEYLLGNLNENSFAQIEEKRRDIQFVERSYLISEECRSCRYHALCKGGCQRNRDYNPERQVYENYFCESYRMFFDTCLEQILELSKYRKR